MTSLDERHHFDDEFNDVGEVDAFDLMHYLDVIRQHKPVNMRLDEPDIQAFLLNVDETPGCYIWKGRTDAKSGFGRFYFAGKREYAHRFMYRRLVEPLDAGLQVRQMCGNRLCVRPEHLVSSHPMYRVWRDVDPQDFPENQDACWIWTGEYGDDDYPRFKIGSKYHRVNRLMYRMFMGPIPPGQLICHECGNKQCVRPTHLRPDTPLGNARDRERHGTTAQSGTRMKATPDEHAYIVMSSESVRALATKFPHLGSRTIRQYRQKARQQLTGETRGDDTQ